MEQREREQYNDFSSIGAYLDPYVGASVEEIESEFREYLAKWYPNDSNVKTIKDVESKLKRFTDLEDEEMEALAKNFSNAMAGRVIPISSLRDAMGAFATLELLGFSSGTTEDHFMQRCREAIAQNPREAAGTLSTLVALFSMDSEPSSKRKASIAKRLLEHAETSLLSSTFDPSLFCKDTPGSKLAEKLYAFLGQQAIGSLPSVNPGLIAEVFLRSDAKGQESIREFFLRLARYPLIPEARKSKFIKWAKQIKGEVEKTDARSRMGRWRQHYFVSNLCELLRALGDESAASRKDGSMG